MVKAIAIRIVNYDHQTFIVQATGIETDEIKNSTTTKYHFISELGNDIQTAHHYNTMKFI